MFRTNSDHFLWSEIHFVGINFYVESLFLYLCHRPSADTTPTASVTAWFPLLFFFGHRETKEA